MDGETSSKERLVSDLRDASRRCGGVIEGDSQPGGRKNRRRAAKIEQSLIEGKKALGDAEQTLRKKSKECAEIADDYVRENPWSAVGIAAAVGLAFGLLIRGK